MLSFFKTVKESFSLPKTPLRFLLSALKRQRTALIALMVAGLIARMVVLLTPVGMQILIDDVLSTRSLDGLAGLISILAIAYAVGLALSFFQIRMSAVAQTSVIMELFGRLFRHTSRLDHANIRSKNIGSFVQRFNELEGANSGVLAPMLTAAVEVPFLIIAAGIAFMYSPTLFLILLGQIILAGLVSVVFQPYVRNSILCQLEQKEVSDTILVEAINGHDTVKMLGAEGRFEHFYDDSVAKTAGTGLITANLNNYATQARTAIARIGSLAIMGAGAVFVVDQTMTLGAFIAFMLVSNHIVKPATRLVNILPSVQALQGTLTRLQGLVEPEAECYVRKDRTEDWGADVPTPVPLRLEAVTIAKAGTGELVIADLDVVAEAGGLTVVRGPSGCGKTTLLRACLGLGPLLSGRIRAGDTDLGSLSVDQRRGLFAPALQPTHLFSISIRENILLGCRGDDPRPAAKLVGADQFITTLTDGYDHVLTGPSAALSSGQRQLVGLARAFAMEDRPILLLDEPLTGLDGKAAKQVIDAIMARRGQQTLLVVSHDGDLATIADRVIDLAGPAGPALEHPVMAVKAAAAR